jgi:hypothetical protein
VKRFLRNNGLAVVTLGVFLVIWLGGQTWAGHRSYNEDQRSHGEATVSFPRYLTTAHFGEATFENWESEFLQMGAYVLLTVRLTQRGSAESKPPGGHEAVDDDPEAHRHDPHAPWPVRRGGLALKLYANSLSIAFFALFALSFALHAATGAREFNNEQVAHGEPTVSGFGFLARSEFWFQSLQNWQSEFLAVGSLVVLTIFLRQQGSPESKPVHAPHRETDG